MGNNERALAILDAELSEPEAREWRAVRIADGSEIDGTAGTPHDWVKVFPQLYRLESRTPAGPWERAE